MPLKESSTKKRDGIYEKAFALDYAPTSAIVQFIVKIFVRVGEKWTTTLTPLTKIYEEFTYHMYYIQIYYSITNFRNHRAMKKKGLPFKSGQQIDSLSMNINKIE